MLGNFRWCGGRQGHNWASWFAVPKEHKETIRTTKSTHGPGRSRWSCNHWGSGYTQQPGDEPYWQSLEKATFCRGAWYWKLALHFILWQWWEWFTRLQISVVLHMHLLQPLFLVRREMFDCVLRHRPKAYFMAIARFIILFNLANVSFAKRRNYSRKYINTRFATISSQASDKCLIIVTLVFKWDIAHSNTYAPVNAIYT